MATTTWIEGDANTSRDCAPTGRDTIANVLDLVLDPQGALHMEPTRLLLPRKMCKGSILGAHRDKTIHGDDFNGWTLR